MSKESNTGCVLAGMLDIKGKDQWRRVYSIHGIAATLVTCGGGQQHMKIFDEKKLRVRKLTPKEYGILQAFPMDDWKQVVSDSQAYKQFGNAVTTTVFTAIAQEIKKSILQSESEEISMKKNKEFKGMNAPEEPPKDETGQEKENPAAVTGKAEAQAAAVGEEPGNITVDALAEKIVANLFEKTILPGIVFDMAVASTIEYITRNLDGLYIGCRPEDLRDWPAARSALEAELDKYAELGPNGVYMIKALMPLKVRLDSGEQTPELFNEILAATR